MDDGAVHLVLMEQAELCFQNWSTVRCYNGQGGVNQAAGCLAEPRMRRISLTLYGHVELKARGTVGHGFSGDRGVGTSTVINTRYACTWRRKTVRRAQATVRAVDPRECRADRTRAQCACVRWQATKAQWWPWSVMACPKQMTCTGFLQITKSGFVDPFIAYAKWLKLRTVSRRIPIPSYLFHCRLLSSYYKFY